MNAGTDGWQRMHAWFRTTGFEATPGWLKHLSQADHENKPAGGRFSCSHYALSMP